MARNLETRRGRREVAPGSVPLPGQFGVVQAVSVDQTGGRAPGLYPDGPPGSSAGLLVYDPAQGDPAVPVGKLAPWSLLIVSEGATIDSVL